MKKIMYTRPDDGGLSIIIPAARVDIEKILGPMTDDQYISHVWESSVPKDAINPRYIDDGGLPKDREFRNAWVDITPDNSINIDCGKARNIKLEELRSLRNAELAKTDSEFVRALESGDTEKLELIKIRRQKLRDATDALKAIEADGIVDDLELLELIRQKSILEDM